MRNLEWKKLKVTGSLLTQMENAVSQLSQTRDDTFQLITHLFRKMYVATTDDVVIFRAGTKTRPARITAIAIDQKAEGNMFVLDGPEGIHPCCD